MMNEEKKYLIAIDLAMGCTGAAIFSNDAEIVLVTSVDTKSEKNHQMKLKRIADFLIEIKKKYPPYTLAVEAGFSRFNKSTQAVYKCHGVAQLIFWDIPQKYYPPCTVKLVAGGRGNLKKKELGEIIKNLYPVINFKNLDETDSVAIALCHFIKVGEDDG